MSEVFHQGEQAVQTLAGEQKIAARVSRMIKSQMNGGAINFIAKQPIAFITSTDENAKVWISVLVGEEGFIEVPDAGHILFDLSKLRSTSKDILFKNVKNKAQVGALFIEPISRLRFRVNGRVVLTDTELKIEAEEAYGNCPKYIQRQQISLPEIKENTPAKISSGSQLEEKHLAWIKQADTFYMGTQSLDGKADASHRGGNTGFVEVIADNTLRIPDYPGNSLFQSLGNIYEQPNTGLLFVDFKKGSTLQLTGEATLEFDQQSSEDLQKTATTGRFWQFEPEAWVYTEDHHQVDWEFVDFSPFNP
ncbi:MAG: pyridoxamine 5'-phosphate oxidase family protein [Bacteroidota bacterium]